MSFKWNKPPIFIDFDTELEARLFDTIQQAYMMATSIVVKGMLKNELWAIIGKRADDEEISRTYSRITKEVNEDGD